MDSIYVCQFSNGHIKVGRSADPGYRIAQHAERVACIGIELIASKAFACEDNIVKREAMLIAECAKNAGQQFKNEWFAGLSFDDVCEWASECAARFIAAEPPKGDTSRDSISEAEVRELLTARRGAWLAIAEAAEVSHSWLSKFVNEHIPNPGIATLRRVRAAIAATDEAA